MQQTLVITLQLNKPMGPGHRKLRQLLGVFKATQAEKLERETAARRRMEAWRRELKEVTKQIRG